MKGMTTNTLSPKSVLQFWFSPQVSELWFNSTPAFDLEVKRIFEPLYQEAMQGKLNDWEVSPEGSLALVIVLDQFPLNMYRGNKESFLSGDRALAAAKNAIQRGFDKYLVPEELPFLYLPFMHSEKLEDQNKSLELFEKAGLKNNLRFAHHHRDIIVRFGRFPHRNPALGRESTPEELAYLSSKEGYHG
jgi:uncharacterized protein (DUF924 family)